MAHNNNLPKEQNNNNTTIGRIFKWIWQRPTVKKLRGHFKEFPYIWLCILLFFVASLLGLSSRGWPTGMVLFGVTFVLMLLLILFLPMNTVYGLMGTTGNIRFFFFNFIFITLAFAGIYQIGFFNNAGISYDINQPHIDFDLYEGKPRVETTLWSEPSMELSIIENGDGTVVRDTTKVCVELNYQPINFWFTWRNTILTALMQEPVEFFGVASTSNSSMNKDDGAKTDAQKAMYFQWVLIFQVLISWIFFGVFISLLYNKFRNES